MRDSEILVGLNRLIAVFVKETTVGTTISHFRGWLTETYTKPNDGYLRVLRVAFPTRQIKDLPLDWWKRLSDVQAEALGGVDPWTDLAELDELQG
jgi:hypothetical protein